MTSKEGNKYKAKPGKRGGRPMLTRAKWDAMLAAYRDVPTVQHMMDVCRVGRNTAKRAIHEGWPEHGWPPFIKLLGQGTTVYQELAKLNETWDDALVKKSESARQAALETMAARIGMGSAIRAARLAHTYVERVLEKVEDDDYELPELTPHVIFQLVKSLEATNMVLAKAIEIQNKRSGQPEHVLGSTIIDLLERCSDDELNEVIEGGGALPPHLMGQKRVIDSEIEALPEDEKEQEEEKEKKSKKPSEAMKKVEVLLAQQPDASYPPYVGPTDPDSVNAALAEIKAESDEDLEDLLETPDDDKS
jgi:hypothetical protein